MDQGALSQKKLGGKMGEELRKGLGGAATFGMHINKII